MGKLNCYGVLAVFIAVVGATRGWNIGVALRYQLSTTILSREAGKPRAGSDVGFQMTGELSVAAVWQHPNDPDTFLLKIEVRKSTAKKKKIQFT